MGEIKTVFLDLDGVVVSMAESVYAYLGLPFNSKDDLLSDEKVYEAAGGKAKFWKFLGTHDFFANLKLYPWSKELVEMIDLTGLDWIFLSKSTMHDGVSSGKSAFIRKHFNRHSNRLWLARGCKSRASGPGKILIDDKKDQNILQWEKAGGIGFHWPELHPSETTEAARRIEELKIILTNGVK